jgi:hypothetical protein
MWWGRGIKNRAVDTVPHQSVSPPRGGAATAAGAIVMTIRAGGSFGAWLQSVTALTLFRVLIAKLVLDGSDDLAMDGSSSALEPHQVSRITCGLAL